MQALEPRAFDVLVYLIDHRHQVSSKAAIRHSCFRDAPVGDGALARTVMKARKAIADLDETLPLIKTVHRVGYRFVGSVETGASAEPPVRAELKNGTGRRLALMPFVNETADDELAWVELGLMSLVAHALQSTPGVGIVPVQDVVAALNCSDPESDVEQRLTAIEAGLDTKLIAWGSLHGSRGRFALRFNLQTADAGTLHAEVKGTDVAAMAVDAAATLRGWLSPGAGGTVGATLDLGDGFSNEAAALALLRSRQNRLFEAEHLFDAALACGESTPEIELEAAKVKVLLARTGVRLWALDRGDGTQAPSPLRAMAVALRGSSFEQQGRMAEAEAAFGEAVELAEAVGHTDLAVEWSLARAGCLSACFDERGAALLSHTLPRADRIGSRVLLAQAFATAARVAANRDEWISALRLSEKAMSYASGLDDSLHFHAKSVWAWTQVHLGQTGEAVTAAKAALKMALVSGKQPDLGLAAIAAAQACMSARQVHDMAELHRLLQGYVGPGSVFVLVASELHCRSTLLMATANHDRALACVDLVSQAVAGTPMFRAWCDATRLKILLHARRFDELSVACLEIRTAWRGSLGTTLNAWVERALALRDCFAMGKVQPAVERLVELFRAAPLNEAQVVATLEAAWMFLERGEVRAALRAVEHLAPWLRQTALGLQVQARLHYESGDWNAAVETQLRFIRGSHGTSTSFQRLVLAQYRRTSVDGRVRPIPLLDEGLDVHWHIEGSALAELPLHLGGTHTSR